MVSTTSANSYVVHVLVDHHPGGDCLITAPTDPRLRFARRPARRQVTSDISAGPNAARIRASEKVAGIGYRYAQQNTGQHVAGASNVEQQDADETDIAVNIGSA
ncbi:hypothetical protein ABFA25_02640 [Mycobacterium lepromatosis]|uniref:hypothetical protein n=1 Tax=Mycobacterium lepromatosis TaxID=480418 RepID=UPI003D803CF9